MQQVVARHSSTMAAAIGLLWSIWLMADLVHTRSRRLVVVVVARGSVVGGSAISPNSCNRVEERQRQVALPERNGGFAWCRIEESIETFVTVRVLDGCC